MFSIFIIIFVGVFLVILFYEGYKDIKVSNTPIRDLPVHYTVLSDTILYWCGENLGKRKKQPRIELRYYQSKKYCGKYLGATATIVVYTKSNISLEQLVNTVIHEYCHHLQFEKPQSQKVYDKLLMDIGYLNHPMEIEARNVASKNTMKCINTISKKMNWV